MLLQDLLNGIGKAIAPKVNNQGQGNLSYNLLQPLAQAQNYIQHGQAPQIGALNNKFNIGNPNTFAPAALNFATQNVINPVVKTGGNALLDVANELGTGIGTGHMLPYNQLRSGLTKLSYQTTGLNPFMEAGNRQQYNQAHISYKPQEVLANLGDSGQFALNFLGAGGLAHGAEAAASPFLSQVGRGITNGAIQGGAFGALSGLSQGRDQSLGSQLLGAGKDAAVGSAFGGVLGGVTPIANKVGGVVSDVLRGTPFSTHTKQVVDQIHSIPGFAQSLSTEVKSNADKVGFMSDMKQHFRNLGLPNVYQSLDRGETKQVARYFTGLQDTLPKSIQSKIEDGLPNQSWGQIAGQAKTALAGQDGFIGFKQDGQKVGIANDAVPNTAPSQKINMFKQGFDRVRNVIESQGPAGKELGANLQIQRNRAETLAGGWVSRLGSVQKLAKNEFENFVDVSEGKAKPVNEAVAKAAQDWDVIRKEIHAASTSGANVIGTQADLFGGAGQHITEGSPLLNTGKIEEYFPHHFDPAQFKKNWQQNIDHLIKTGQATTPEEAAQKLRFAADTIRNRKFGNLEASRMVDLPGYEKTKSALFNYIEGASNRISQAEVFGPKDEKSLALINQIAQSGGDADTVKHLYDVAVGAKKYSQGSQQFTGNLRKVQSTTKLGLGALTNVGQNVNTATVAGVRNTLGSMIAAHNPANKEFALKAGITLEGALNDVKEGGGFTGKVLGKITAPGFGKVENFNRVVAANAGKGYAEQMAKAAASGSQSAIKALETMGLNAADVAKRGSLTEEEAIKAARNIVERTQFKVDPQDLPGWTASPWGKLVTQFKTFSYNQTAFVGREIISQARHGNLAPLARFVAVGIPVGGALTETRNLLQNRKPEQDTGKRALQYFNKVGGLGLAGDALTSFFPQNSGYLSPERRTQMAESFLLGPTVSDAASTFSNVSQAVQGKPENLGRQALRTAPVVGSTLQNTLLPYKNAQGGTSQLFSLAQPVNASDQTAAPTPQAPTTLSATDKYSLDKQISDLKKQVTTEQKASAPGPLAGIGIGKGQTDDQKNQKVSQLQSQIDSLTAQKSYADLQDKVTKLASNRSTDILTSGHNASEKLSLAKSIGGQVLDGTLTHDQAVPLIQKLGVDPQRVTYALAAELPTDQQAAYVMESVGNGAKLQDLISNKVLTGPVADELFLMGKLDPTTHEAMKKYITAITNPVSKIPKARKAKKLSLKLPQHNFRAPKGSTRVNRTISRPKITKLKVKVPA